MKKIIISIISILTLVACSGGGKSKYQINDIDINKEVSELSEFSKEKMAAVRHFLFEAELADKQLRSGELKVVYKKEMYDIDYTRGYFSLDDYCYFNTGGRIRRGDIVYTCYNEEEECFYFVKANFNQPLDSRVCYCVQKE